jgi:hypothetical protein
MDGDLRDVWPYWSEDRMTKPARRTLRLSFPETGEWVEAELLDDEAPEVCRIVWDLLPVEGKAMHGMYSGAEVFVLLDDPAPHPPENLCQLPLPGELLLFHDAMSSVLGSKGPVREVCFVYNRGVTLRCQEGVPTYASLFARVPGDWKYDWPEFRAACRGVRTVGRATLRIERGQGYDG